MPLASAKPGITKDHRVAAAKAVPVAIKPRMAHLTAAAAAPRVGFGIGAQKGSYHFVFPDDAGPPSKKARLESSAPAAVAMPPELGPGPPSKTKVKARLEPSSAPAAVAVPPELGPGPPSAAAVAVPPPPRPSWSRRCKVDKEKPPPIELTDDEFDEQHSASAATTCSCSQCAYKAEKRRWQDAARLGSDSRFTWLAHKATGLGCVLCNKCGSSHDVRSQYGSFQVSDGQNYKLPC